MTENNENKRARVIFSRALHTYFLARRGLTLGVRAVVRSDDGKFLLVRHTYTHGWHFPGGGVEKGQTAQQALRDELRQETGLLLVGTPVLHGVFHNYEVSKRDHVLVYLCNVEGKLEVKAKSLEIAEIGYFSLEDLPTDINPGTMRRIQAILAGEEISETW